MKRTICAAALLTLLSACATAPVPVAAPCPKVPPLGLKLTAGALETDFIGNTQKLLQGKLP